MAKDSCPRRVFNYADEDLEYLESQMSDVRRMAKGPDSEVCSRAIKEADLDIKNLKKEVKRRSSTTVDDILHAYSMAMHSVGRAMGCGGVYVKLKPALQELRRRMYRKK